MKNKSWFFNSLVGLLALIGILAFISCRHSATNADSVSDSNTETIGRGEVTSSIQAYGTVMSEKDILLLSPERCIIKKVLQTPGNKVAKGDLLMELDEESVMSEIDRMENQLEQRRNALEKMQLNTESTRLDMKQNEEAKQIRVDRLKETLADQEKLVQEGKLPASRLERTREEIARAENDLENVSQKYAIRIAQQEADENTLQIQVRSQEENLREKKALLGKLNLKAPVPGVILDIQGDEGAQVDEGRMLVRMSDLSSFKVVGMIEGKYSFLVQTGNRAVVTVDGEQLEGQIGRIVPIMDQRIQFDVHLADNSNPKLIPDQNLPIEIFSSEQNNVLRMKKQAGYEQAGRTLVYRIEGKEGSKTEVVFGTVGGEWCEIVSGLNEGDRILVGGADPKTGPQTIVVKN